MTLQFFTCLEYRKEFRGLMLVDREFFAEGFFGERSWVSCEFCPPYHQGEGLEEILKRAPCSYPGTRDRYLPSAWESRICAVGCPDALALEE